jgi:VWFA-related protein
MNTTKRVLSGDRSLDQQTVVEDTQDVIKLNGMLPLPKSTVKMVMDQVAAVSGGRAFWPKSSDSMDEIFEQIALELRRQYSIGYRRSNFAADGKLHKIKVVLTVPRQLSREMVVRNRNGYFAVAKPAAHWHFGKPLIPPTIQS